MSRKWHAVDRARQSEISACIAWVLSNWFSQRCSANCPIFQLRHYNVIWTLEMSSALNIRTALSCNLLLPYSASQWADGIATIIKTSPHAQARSSVYAVYVCLTRTLLLSPVCCSVFKEKHDGRTRKYLSEGDGVESHWVPWGLFTGHAHKYRTISPRWQVERRGSWWVKGCREKRGNIAIVNEP